MSADRLYQDNPFRTLGLPVTAPAAQVEARARQLAIEPGHGADPLGISEPPARRAVRSLSDSTQRLRAELFWLHGDEPAAPPTLRLDDRQAVARALSALAAAAADRSKDAAARAVAKHDAAVVAHAACLRHGWLGPDLVAAIDRWSAVFGDVEYWRHLASRARSIGVTLDPIPMLRDHLADWLGTTLIDAASELLDDGQDDAALALVVALKLSHLPRPTIDGVIREVTLPLRAAVRSGATTLLAFADAIGDLPDSRDLERVREQLDKATSGLRGDVILPLQRLRRLAPEADDPLLADKASQATARLAALAANRLDDWHWAFGLVGEAAALARSAGVKEEIATARGKLRYTYHRLRAQTAFQQDDGVSALAHCELAQSFASTDEVGAQIRQAIDEIAAGLNDIERHKAQALAREIETRLPKRLEARPTTPAPLPVASDADPERVAAEVVAEPNPAEAPVAPPPTPLPAATNRNGTVTKFPEKLRRREYANLDGAAVDPPVPPTLLLDRGQAGPRFPQPVTPEPAPGSEVVRWLRVPSHWPQVGLPFAAALLLAIVASGVFPFGNQPASPGANDVAPGGSDRPAAVSTTAPHPFEEVNTSQGGVAAATEAADSSRSSCAALPTPSAAVAAQIDARRESIATLDTQIAVITARYPNGTYPTDVAAQLTALQSTRADDVETLNDLLAGSSVGRRC
jgi:hypothetical protein